MQADENRLTKIEEKLDKVGDALLTLARMEERMISLFKRMDAYDAALQTAMNKLIELEKKNASTAWIERLFWIAITVGMTVLINIGLKQ